jgi:hypothetical protein
MPAQQFLHKSLLHFFMGKGAHGLYSGPTRCCRNADTQRGEPSPMEGVVGWLKIANHAPGNKYTRKRHLKKKTLLYCLHSNFVTGPHKRPSAHSIPSHHNHSVAILSPA